MTAFVGEKAHMVCGEDTVNLAKLYWELKYFGKTPLLGMEKKENGKTERNKKENEHGAWG